MKFKKPSNWYKELVIRPVVKLDGYEKHEKVCERVAEVYYSLKCSEAELRRLVIQDPLANDAAPVTIYTIFRIAQAKCPTYFLNKNLVEALLRSDLDLDPNSINWAMESGIFMLPLDTVYFAVPGVRKSIVAIFWHFDRSERILYWVTTNWRDYFCRRFPLDANPNNLRNSCSENYDAKTLEEFNDFINSLLLKLLLVMQSRPEFIEEPDEEEKPVEVQFAKGGFTKQNKIDLYQPLWIGKDYVPKKHSKRTKESKGTHASPRVHWRRGHFRNQKIGEGRKESKLVWIEPVLVMG